MRFGVEQQSIRRVQSCSSTHDITQRGTNTPTGAVWCVRRSPVAYPLTGWRQSEGGAEDICNPPPPKMLSCMSEVGFNCASGWQQAAYTNRSANMRTGGGNLHFTVKIRLKAVTNNLPFYRFQKSDSARVCCLCCRQKDKTCSSLTARLSDLPQPISCSTGSSGFVSITKDEGKCMLYTRWLASYN